MKLPEIPGGLPRQSFNTEPEVCDDERCVVAVRTAKIANKGRSPEAVRQQLETDMESVYIKAGCDPKVCLPLRRLRKR